MWSTDISLTERAESALRQCRMKEVRVPGHDWGVRVVPQGPHPLLVFVGDCPRGIDDGYDFLSWAEAFGFYVEDQLGELPFIVVTIEQAPAHMPVTVVAYVEGAITMTIWESMSAARISLPVAYPPTSLRDENH